MVLTPGKVFLSEFVRILSRFLVNLNLVTTCSLAGILEIGTRFVVWPVRGTVGVAFAPNNIATLSGYSAHFRDIWAQTGR